AANIDALKEERKLFREQNPEYAAYYDWSLQVSDAEGGALAYWRDTLADNPNAQRYLASLDEAESGDIERRLTSVEAFFAAEGLRPTGYDPDPLSTGPALPATTSEGTGFG